MSDYYKHKFLDLSDLVGDRASAWRRRAVAAFVAGCAVGGLLVYLAAKA